ncbi:MAG TPA: hypothetical protein VHX88_00210 [Solirubrobacteraceae bacterium]|nr:hypothetical protein [Solirubrobacteraceae bacterium]
MLARLLIPCDRNFGAGESSILYANSPAGLAALERCEAAVVVARGPPD